jgi:hypothetical protein
VTEILWLNYRAKRNIDYKKVSFLQSTHWDIRDGNEIVNSICEIFNLQQVKACAVFYYDSDNVQL